MRLPIIRVKQFHTAFVLLPWVKLMKPIRPIIPPESSDCSLITVLIVESITVYSYYSGFRELENHIREERSSNSRLLIATCHPGEVKRSAFLFPLESLWFLPMEITSKKDDTFPYRAPREGPRDWQLNVGKQSSNKLFYQTMTMMKTDNWSSLCWSDFPWTTGLFLSLDFMTDPTYFDRRGSI